MTARTTVTTAVIGKILKRASLESTSRQIQDDPFSGFYDQGKAVQPPLPFEQLLSLAETNAVHAASLHAATVDAVGRGWKLEKTVRSRKKLKNKRKKLLVPGELPEPVDDDENAEDEEALRVKLSEVCTDFNFLEMLEQAVLDLRMVGNSAWEATRDDSEQLDGLFPMPVHELRYSKHVPLGPGRKPISDSGKWAGLFVQVRGDKLRYFKKWGMKEKIHARTGNIASDSTPKKDLASEVIYFRSYSYMSRYYGVPRWIAGIPAMTELSAIREFNVSFYSSGGQVDKIVLVTDESKEVAEQLAKNIEQQVLESQGQAHVTCYVGGRKDTKVAVEFLSTREGQREGQFGERRNDLVKEVLMVHNMPPYRVGWADLGGLGGNAAKEMLRAYRSGTVDPLQEVVEECLSTTLFSEDGIPLKQGLRWRLVDVDWDLVQQNLEIAVKTVMHGIQTPFQAAKMLGLEPIDVPEAHVLYNDGLPLGQPKNPIAPKGEKTPPEENAKPDARKARRENVRDLQRGLRRIAQRGALNEAQTP